MLPESKLVKSQYKTYVKEEKNFRIECEVRWDNRCRNKHNSFSITGTTYTKQSNGKLGIDSAGCIHDEITEYFPDLSHLIAWHSFTSEGYMYLSNITYHASDKDRDGFKAINIDAARSCANFPDATLEQLRDEQLLKNRLPELMLQLKKDIEALGMVY